MTIATPTQRAALVLQKDAEYATISPDPARVCSNCRWYSELPGTAQCHLVADSPEPINGGAWCNRHEPMPDGSAVITYMDDFGVNNPNNGNIPAGVLADSIMHSEAALENLNTYFAGVNQPQNTRTDESDDTAYADEQTRAVPAKYEHINFKPTETMANAAERALEWRAEYGRGGTEVGVARARDLKNRVNLSPETVRRMKAYFDRHESDKQGEGWSPGEDGYPSAGRIAWGLWGDDAGYSWSRQRVESMNAADEKERGTTRSGMPVLASMQAATMLRFVDRAVTALDGVQGCIRGFVALWGNPDRVQFAPGMNVCWGDGATLQYGRVADLMPDDVLSIELHQCVPGRRWIPLGTRLELPRSAVRATDQHGTWFDAARPPEMGLANGMHRRPIMLEHAGDSVGAEIVGTITRVWSDDEGIHFDAELDRSLEVFPRVIEKIQRGDYKTSSSTMEHTGIIRSDGSFETWIIGEHTLTESPSERRMPSVTLIRSQAHEGLHDATRAGDEPSVSIEIEIQPEHESQSQGEKEMTPEQLAMLQQLVAEFGMEAVMAALQQAQQQPAPAPAEAMSATPQAPADMRSLIDTVRATLTATQQNAEVVALRSRIAALEAANNSPPVQATETTRAARQVGAGVNVNSIPDRRTSNLSASDMWFVQQALGANGKPVSEAFTRSMVAKSVDAFQPAAKAGDEFAQNFVRSFGNKRADEIMATNIAGQGTEWVGVAYATDLWEKIRVAPIYDAFRSLGMMEMELGQGQNSIYVPTEGADPTWYSAPEANDTSSGRIEVTSNPQFVGTGRVQVTPGTLKATVAWSEELDEDSLIPMASWLNTQMARSAAEVAEYVLINGDTVITATTNLNLIDGTPGTGASRPAYLATNGILKLPIITTTALSYDANNTHTEDTYLSVLRKLPDNVNGDVNNVVFILGVQEHFAAINIPAFKTRDVNSQATVENGVLTRIYGRKVLMSGQIALANTAGKISATPGNNLYGRIIAAVPRYWAVVNKRDVRFKLSEDPYNDAQLLRVSFRMGATYRSTTSAAAAAYEVAV